MKVRTMIPMLGLLLFGLMHTRQFCHKITVNAEIFARVLFRETSHMRSFVKIKSSRNGEITLSSTDVYKSCLSREF